MLNEVKSRFLSGKKIFTITILIIGLTTFTNAQGITNTLGGNTSADKFIVENSDSEASLVVTGEGKVGIGTTSPRAKLQVSGDNGVVFIGTLNKGTVPMEGEGTRMMWYPKKAAFRAGYVLGEQWNDSNIGHYSTALGCVTVASGIASTALGYHTYAEAYASVALGRFNVGGGSYGWINTEPLFEIGIGTDESNRKNAFTVLKSGNVGIGTAAPHAKLHVISTTTSDADNTAKFEATSIGSNASHIHYGTKGDWYIRSATDDGKVVIQDSGGNVGIGTNSPDAKLDVEGTVKIGVNGLVFSEIIELTGNTAYGVTDISLPSGYTEDNTRVLSLEIFSEFVGGWAGLGDDSAPGAYSFNDDNISYVLHDDMISIQHPKKVEWWEKPFRIILMKMP